MSTVKLILGDNARKLFPALLVITGCCHSGLVNTVTPVRTMTGDYPLHTLLGGFHLMHAGFDRITATGDYRQSTCVKRVIPCHCMGDYVITRMQEQLGTMVEPGYTGMVVE